MAVNRLKKELIFELNTDLEKVNKEVSALEKNLSQAKWAEREARAEGDKHKLALIQQQKALAELRKQQKAARAALKAHAAEQEKSTGVFSTLTNSLNLQTLAMGALAGAAYKVVGYFGSVIDAGKQWDGTVGDLGDSTQHLARVTDDLISELSLARLVEYQKELKLTELQTEAISKAAVHYGRVAKVDFNQALQSVTDMVVNARVRGLSKLGIVMDEVSGTQSEKMKLALDALTEKFGDITIAASNADEESIKFKNTQEALEGRMGQTIVKTAAYRESVKALAKAKEWLIKGLTNTVYYLSELQDEMVHIIRHGFGPFSDAIMTVAETLGIADNQLEKLLSGMKGFEKVAVHSSSRAIAELEKETEAIVKGGPKVAKAVIDARQKIIAAEKKINDKRKRDLDREKTKTKREKDKEDREAQRKEQRALRYQQRARESYERKLTQLKRNHANQREQIAKNLEASEEKRIAREAKEHEKRISRIEEHTSAFYNAAVANAISATSFGQFMEKMVADSINYLGQLAIKEAIKETALGLSALGTTWGIPNPSSLSHFASAAMWGALGIGGQIAGAAVSSHASGGGGGSATGSSLGGGSAAGGSSGYRSSSISSSREQEKSSVPTQVNNYYIHGRSDLLTRKDIQQISKKLAQGRS